MCGPDSPCLALWLPRRSADVNLLLAKYLQHFCFCLVLLACPLKEKICPNFGPGVSGPLGVARQVDWHCPLRLILFCGREYKE